MKQWIVDFCARPVSGGNWVQMDTVTIWAENPVRTLENMMARAGLEVTAVMYQKVAFIPGDMQLYVGCVPAGEEY
jgi:hypothetical protein